MHSSKTGLASVVISSDKALSAYDCSLSVSRKKYFQEMKNISVIIQKQDRISIMYFKVNASSVK